MTKHCGWAITTLLQRDPAFKPRPQHNINFVVVFLSPLFPIQGMFLEKTAQIRIHNPVLSEVCMHCNGPSWWSEITK